MPPRALSRLLALALAASAFACLTAVVPGDTTSARAGHTELAREPAGPPAPRRHVSSHVRRKRTLGERAARVALGEVGVPYRWGGSSPSSGFDCSGLVHWAYGRLGVDLPHSSYALASEGRRVPRSRLRPGDLLFFHGNGHVGVYIGRGRMVHAPRTGRRVEVVRLGRSSYGSQLIGARRVIHA